MCVVVDSCTFSSVFNRKSADHCLFSPILEWLIIGRGKIVYGGTKYKDELRRAPRYIRIFGEFKKAGKIVEIPDSEVDKRQKELEDFVNDLKFDDAHIAGIICVSRCRLVCTNDSTAMQFLRRADLYPKGLSRPKFFSGKEKNRHLLCDAHIIEICKGNNTISRNLCELFNFNT